MASFQRYPFDDSISGWANHFKLSEQTIEVLSENIGVLTLEDLVVVYTDELILNDLQNYLRRLDYLKFIKAKDDTLRLLTASGSEISRKSDSEQSSLGASSRDDPAIQPNILMSSPRNSSTDHEECSSNDISQLYELVEASVVAIPVVSVINNDVERDQPERTGGIPNASPVNTGYSRESFLLSLLDLDSFVHRPVPQLHGRVRCYILRKRIGDNWHHPVYSLYIEENHKFLLSGKKSGGSISLSSNLYEVGREENDYVAEVNSNYKATEHLIAYDDEESEKFEIGAVTWDTKSTFSNNPRTVDVAIPKLGLNDEFSPWKPTDQQDSLLSLLKKKQYAQFEYLRNLKPRWNEELKCYSLNYGGRAKMISVKNFQLVRPWDPDRVVLQFGKVSNDKFILDFEFPFTPVQAFAVALTAFDY